MSDKLKMNNKFYMLDNDSDNENNNDLGIKTINKNENKYETKPKTIKVIHSQINEKNSKPSGQNIINKVEDDMFKQYYVFY